LNLHCRENPKLDLCHSVFNTTWLELKYWRGIFNGK